MRVGDELPVDTVTDVVVTWSHVRVGLLGLGVS